MREQGILLKSIRLRFKKTQDQMSKILGFKRTQHVSNIERGKSPLGLDMANKLIDENLTTKKEVGGVLICDYMRRINTELVGDSLWKEQ